MKKQRAIVVPKDEPTPPQDQASIQLAPRDQPSPARESSKDESLSGSDDREEPPSAMDGPEVQPPPARAPGDQHEEGSTPDDPPSQLSQGTGKGSCKSKKPRKNFQLTPEHEDNLLEWLRKNELLWRRGHMQFKDVQKKRSLWEKKAQEFGLTIEHLQGWWRGMQTWFVKLHKVKSGQATKKLTDREMYVLQKCSFYEGQLRHRSTAPLKLLDRDVEADALGQLSDVGDLDGGDRPTGDGAADTDLPTDPDLDQDQFLSQLERGAAKKFRTSKRPAGGTRRRTATEEEDVLKDIRDSMKVSTELLSQLVHKSDQGPREPFITYLSETLRTLPEDQYHVVMKHITSLLNNLR
ncbi:uncharacterized protein LOC143033835 [Oratosquilla oratoria]|uniref:uncharacterized protein LOC143033835 n=1 Tax=Oratosquilla oratoria TaxID=337810 RepID=UPI003F767712